MPPMPHNHLRVVTIDTRPMCGFQKHSAARRAFCRWLCLARLYLTSKRAVKLLLASLVCTAISLPGALLSHANLATLEITEVPAATAKQSRKIKLINYLIDKSHYRKKPLDDNFSADVLQSYIEKLDSTKNIFMQSDIDQFAALRYRFDDFIRDGTIQPVFVIFNIFRKRMDERVEYALARLDKPFDFTLEESYQFNREQAQWGSSIQELDDLWRKRIKNDIINLRLTDKDATDITSTLKRRYTHLARRARQLKSEDVFQIFINAYLNTVDPHTSYFLPRASENFNIQMRLSLEGIGAVLQTDNEYTQVRRIIPGGPAALGQELKAEDRIIGVAQDTQEMVDVIGWRLDDVVELIRGPKESTVRLEILPAEGVADSPAKVIAIRRDKINLEEQAAKKRTLSIETAHGKASIGVIDLPSFYSDFSGMSQQQPDYRSTTRDVRKLLAEFADEEISGLVIDLRSNGGGSLDEAVDLAGLFIEKGPVVQTKNVAGIVKINRDQDPEIVYTGPLAVLVDRYSASASEIFAGAIQDYRRGLIIGEPTFGKGTVQYLVNLNRFTKNDSDLGQLKLTVAQFFRINGDSTQHRGVIPDIIWPNASDNDEFGERAYENAIPWLKIGNARFQHFPNHLNTAELEPVVKLHQQRIQTDPEFQHLVAIQKINKQLRDRKIVSLNEDTRVYERTARDQQRLELENRLRQVLGKETWASIEDLEQERKEKSKAAEANRLGQEADAFLRESGSILSDYLDAMEALGKHYNGVTKPNSDKSNGLIGS